jgi:hypothetical protein
MIQHTHRLTLPGGGQVEVTVTEADAEVRIEMSGPPIRSPADRAAYEAWLRPILERYGTDRRPIRLRHANGQSARMDTLPGGVSVGWVEQGAAPARATAGAQYPRAPHPLPEPAPAGPARPLLVREYRVERYTVEFSVTRPDYFGPFRLDVTWSPDVPRGMNREQRRAYRRVREAFMAEVAAALGLEGRVSVVVEV